MKKSIDIAIRMLVALLILTSVARAQEPRFRVAAYLPDYRMADFKPDDAKGVNELILFSATPRDDGTIDLAGLRKAPLKKLKEWKARENGRLILALGGWGRSQSFASVAASLEKSKKLAANALETCRGMGLDGVDLDWEHPKSNAEADDYARLLSHLHGALMPDGKIVSITVAGWQPLSPKTYQEVDCIQLMAYDHQGRHSTFESVAEEVNKLIEKGVPKEKLRLGLPFYGRGIKDAQKTVIYSQIVAQYHPKPDVDEVDSVYFNGPDTIRRKVKFAKEQRLAGVMVWEIGQDARGADSLLRVVVDETKR